MLFTRFGSRSCAIAWATGIFVLIRCEPGLIPCAFGSLVNSSTNFTALLITPCASNLEAIELPSSPSAIRNSISAPGLPFGKSFVGCNFIKPIRAKAKARTTTRLLTWNFMEQICSSGYLEVALDLTLSPKLRPQLPSQSQFAMFWHRAQLPVGSSKLKSWSYVRRLNI